MQSPIILSGPLVRAITDTSAVVEWQTDEPTLGGARVGTSNPPTTPVAESDYVTLHSVELTNLTADTLYYVDVYATDESGNGPVSSSVVSFQTLTVTDIDPPLILDGPVVTSITHNSAVVEWTTNEPADSVVDYGTTQGLSQQASDASLLTHHAVELTGLSSSTNYFVQASSTDSFSNGPTSSNIIEFYTLAAPDNMPPVIISAPMAINITSTEATIVWQTDEPATSGVSYNDGTAYGVAQDGALVMQHSVHLTGLSTETTYYFTVSSTDGEGNGPTLSDTFEFTTLSIGDVTPPVITEGPYLVNPTHKSAVIRWKTDEPSDSVIEYGTTGLLGYEESRAALVTTHNLVLHGLEGGVGYFFRVLSTDKSGNGPTPSDIYWFITRPTGGNPNLEFTTSPRVINTTDDTATIYWETSEAADTSVTYEEASAPGLVRVVSDTRIAASGERSTGHYMTLTNLSSGTEYTFDVQSIDHEGDVASTTTFSTGDYLRFSTSGSPDTTPPTFLTAPSFVSLSDDMALVRWTTDEVSDSRVWFGPSGGSLDHFSGDTGLTTEHYVVLTNLSSNTVYSINAESADVAGNIGDYGSTVDGTTTGSSDSTAPTFTAGPTTYFASAEGTIIRWTTNEYVTAQVRYGSASGTLDKAAALDSFGNSQQVILSDLLANSTFYYQVTVRDIEGNETNSSILSFTTTVTGLDTDNDGISDYDELHLYGTDPLLRDTDGDGVDDDVEIAAGTNPRVAAPVGMAHVWVDFYHIGSETGEQATPLVSFIDAISLVDAGGTVHIAAGTSSETGTFSNSLTIVSTGGLVRIGVPE